MRIFRLFSTQTVGLAFLVEDFANAKCISTFHQVEINWYRCRDRFIEEITPFPDFFNVLKNSFETSEIYPKCKFSSFKVILKIDSINLNQQRLTLEPLNKRQFSPFIKDDHHQILKDKHFLFSSEEDNLSDENLRRTNFSISKQKNIQDVCHLCHSFLSRGQLMNCSVKKCQIKFCISCIQKRFHIVFFFVNSSYNFFRIWFLMI